MDGGRSSYYRTPSPAFLTEILSRLKTGACSIDLLQYYRRNELWDFVVYVKCQNPDCGHCGEINRVPYAVDQHTDWKRPCFAVNTKHWTGK